MKQLRFTTSKPMGMGFVSDPLIIPINLGSLTFCDDELKTDRIFIDGEAEKLAGYDIPIFLDGDLSNINLPIEEQDILMVIPEGNFECQVICKPCGFLKELTYLIHLKK